MASSGIIGDAERQYIIRGAELNVRSDGRHQQEFRRKELQLGVIAQATGSSRVRIGGTDVIVGVKAEIGAPLEDQPHLGRVLFSVECSPVANPAFRGRGGEDLSSEITKSLERSMFVSPSSNISSTSVDNQPIDLSQLSIVSGKSCWILYIDALLLDIDGSYIDAVSVGVKAALSNAKIPKIELIQGEDLEPEYEVDDDPEACAPLNITNMPIILRICRVGTICIVDPSGNEEECASAMLDVAVNAKGNVCGITKRKEKGLQPSVLLEMMSIAQNVGPKVHRIIDSFLLDASKENI